MGKQMKCIQELLQSLWQSTDEVQLTNKVFNYETLETSSERPQVMPSAGKDTGSYYFFYR